ncbi:hypothetical protein BJX63DRAFT_108840 [Aspergillus granulosus]|uniref:Uncharacterized protein n=1 Tax=Aspergillus granulosus TaxID=176169 RepID=A0ABR4HP94_9EURO
MDIPTDLRKMPPPPLLYNAICGSPLICLAWLLLRYCNVSFPPPSSLLALRYPCPTYIALEIPCTYPQNLKHRYGE